MAFSDLIKGLLIYKEPKKIEEFELLEDLTEDTEEPDDSELSAKRDPLKKEKRIRRPIHVDAFNENKKDKQEEKSETVYKQINKNLERIKAELNYPLNQDIIIRTFKVQNSCDAFLVYIDGMVDKSIINDFILRQLMQPDLAKKSTCNTDFIINNLMSVNEVIKQSNFSRIIAQVLSGQTALFIEGSADCLLIDSKGFEKRDISTPKTETVVKGSQEGFVENLRTNITQIRRIIKNKNLLIEILPIGDLDNNNCAVLYMKNIVNPVALKEIKRRISNLNIDFIPAGGVLEQLIEEPNRMLPQILSTERPDRTASFIMEGKIAIICDGTPFASIAPVTIYHFLHTSEDSNLRWQYGTFIRLIRYFGIFVSMLLPALYVALILYHQEMIPTEMLESIARAREGLPFPTIVELLLMETAWELIREAGIRVPGVIGQTLGIVGAIILGQAAVAAKLVSPILIIIVAISGLGNFAIPSISLSLSARIVRFIFTLLGATSGFYGIATGLFVLGALACSVKSFGVPLFSPIAPKTTGGEALLRYPIWKQKLRPDFLNTKRKRRQGERTQEWNSGKGQGQ